MQTRNLSRTGIRSASSTQAVQLNWQYVLLVLICGAIVAAGFFFAARQHFMSMDYGFKNSKLRKQLEDLEAEKRRLVLARETSLSPAEIRKAATKAAALRAENSSKAVIAVSATANSSTGVEGRTSTSNIDRNSIKPVRTAYIETTRHALASDKQAKTVEHVDRNEGLEIAAVAKLR